MEDGHHGIVGVEFKPWPKIKRKTPLNVRITEKINGTNGCIVIDDGQIVGVQNRKRFLSSECDNYGFYSWVMRNQSELLKLGDGYHYGEWAGPGIQKNPHGLPEKCFFLFYEQRWSQDPNLPKGCFPVPLLYEGTLHPLTIEYFMSKLKQEADPGTTPEGVVVQYMSLGTRSKHTFNYPEGKWKDAKITKV
jgi:hypothetical protein